MQETASIVTIKFSMTEYYGPILMLKKRNTSIYVTMALLGGFFLWGAEMAVRRFPQIMLPQWRIRYYVNHTKSKVVPDTEVGFRVPPNQHDVIQTSDFTFVRDTDSKGFPNKDPWPERVSIVFLGDSLIVAGQEQSDSI
jgi:hypothetical protein